MVGSQWSVPATTATSSNGPRAEKNHWIYHGFGQQRILCFLRGAGNGGGRYARLAVWRWRYLLDCFRNLLSLSAVGMGNLFSCASGSCTPSRRRHQMKGKVFVLCAGVWCRWDVSDNHRLHHRLHHARPLWCHLSMMIHLTITSMSWHNLVLHHDTIL